MRIRRRTTDNAREVSSGTLQTRLVVASGALRGFLFGACFPAGAWLLDRGAHDLAWSWESVVRLHLEHPVHWIVDVAPLGLAGAGALIAQGRMHLLEHRRNLEASVREQTTALVSFASDLKRKNTALKRANRAAEAARARFEQMFRGLPIAAFTLDSEGRIAFWNAEATRVFGLSAADVVGRPPEEALPFDAPEGEVAEAVQRVYRGFERRAIERTIVRPDGKRVSLLCSTFPLLDPSGAMLGAVSTATDTSALKAMETELERQLERNRATSTELVRINRLLREQATTDGLTGLKNHRAFQDRACEAFEHAASRNESLSLAMIDADHFKAYNDAFGHPAGDTVLELLASILSDSTRTGDTAARYGGEEFAILLRATDADQAMAFAERLRKVVELAEWPNRPMTVSIGVATLDASMAAASDLIEAADRALYNAKARGRNRCTHIRELQATPTAAVEPS